MPQATQNPLRAVFAGIGRILSVTDKVRNKPAATEAPAASPAPDTMVPDTTAPESAAAPETTTPETTATEAPKAETAPAETAAPETIIQETAAPEPEAAPAAPEADVAATAPEVPAVSPEAEVPAAVPEAEAGAAPEAVAPKAAATAPGDLPLANYDTLTIASVRARLRNLSVEQLNTLVAHEKANAGREDFISMLERRIAKVESGK